MLYENILKALPVIAVIIFVIIICAMGYVKAPPDTAYIISGLRKRKKIVIGRAAVRIPFLERLDKLSLKLIPVDVKTANPVPTADYINIQVDAAVNIKVSTDKGIYENGKWSLGGIDKASENFLNMSTLDISLIAKEVLEGNMREIVGRMRLEEMVSDRKRFAEEVQQNVAPDLSAMGLDIISFNVQNFSDTNGVIDDLGIDNTSQIKKRAAIAKAEAEKEISISQSEATRQAEEARINSHRDIARKENQLSIERAELKLTEDTKKAEADAAYIIQEQQQRKTIEITSAQADIAKQEQAVTINRQMALAEEEKLNATVRKQADAALYKRQKDADALRYEEQSNAESELFKQEKEAEAIKHMGLAEASKIESIGKAQAEATRQKGLAEAEAMQKKAEAYAKYDNAAIAEMMISVMPEIAARIAEPLTKIDKITIIGSGNDSGLSSAADGVPTVMAKMMETMRETTGINLADLINSQSYDAKVNRNIKLSGEVKNLPLIEPEDLDE